MNKTLLKMLRFAVETFQHFGTNLNFDFNTTYRLQYLFQKKKPFFSTTSILAPMGAMSCRKGFFQLSWLSTVVVVFVMLALLRVKAPQNIRMDISDVSVLEFYIIKQSRP